MRHGSLFSGIGGFDLAAEWMGWENIFHCEWNKFGQQVLHYYWPKAICYENICTTDFRVHRGTIDILTGGFPCQPYSSAGKRLGKEDERHLWPEMLRAIREIQPRWIVGENVRGLTNWNGGVVFDEVQSDLEAQGYEVTPFLLPACAVNAPHRRDRIWFVAYNNSFIWRTRWQPKSAKQSRHGESYAKSNTKNDGFVAHSTCTSERANELQGIRPENGKIEGEGAQAFYDAIRPNGFEGITTNSNSNGLNQRNSDNEINTSEGRVNALGDFDKSNGDGDVTYTDLQRCYKSTSPTFTNKQKRQYSQKNFISKSKCWQNFPTVSPVCIGDDGLSDRLDSITFSKWRNESIKAGGNAVVPQVVMQIFKTIQLYERTKNSDSNKKTP